MIVGEFQQIKVVVCQARRPEETEERRAVEGTRELKSVILHHLGESARGFPYPTLLSQFLPHAILLSQFPLPIFPFLFFSATLHSQFPPAAVYPFFPLPAPSLLPHFDAQHVALAEMASAVSRATNLLLRRHHKGATIEVGGFFNEAAPKVMEAAHPRGVLWGKRRRE
ncbi:hypothetical protein E2C01_046058 [Portunus trituberculatus]|uniref:Uncharacterized protein n=1 Tax=Portunus trituberculatus TaxID=210409 RepID=A0A5B7G382_PORTR|nr:hypothetical protein [Portunus trituberculatus]